MAHSTLVTAFDDREQATLAYDELKIAGFKEDQLGFAIRGDDAVRGGMMHDTVGAKDGEGALKGMATGGAIGGILGAAAAAMVPGVGPVLAGGILAGMAGGAAAGAATGGIFGAMHGLGVSEEEAVHYQRAFDCGKAIVTVDAGERQQEAQAILLRHGGYKPCPPNPDSHSSQPHLH